jgi:D-beta-D-heptose 7-phosphate kinase / D-beta-D-heptose 1-phosphate adenosyltransferase
VVGADVVQRAGGSVVLAELVPGQSTTAIVGRMRAPAVTA